LSTQKTSTDSVLIFYTNILICVFLPHPPQAVPLPHKWGRLLHRQKNPIQLNLYAKGITGATAKPLF
jgi:hypothetical protein